MTYVGEPVPPPDSPPPARPLTGPIVGLTLITIGAYFLRLLVQIATARFFGAGPDLDAFFAAFALPQYVSAIVGGVLASICVPIIVSTAHRSGRDEAQRVAQGITYVVVAAMLLLTVLCALFSSPLLRLVAPGLSPSAHATAARLAWVLWLTVVTSSVVVLATSIDNAEHRFYRAAFVPLVGGILNLLLLVALAGPLGVLGAAFATTAAGVGQLLLFASALGHHRHSIRNAIAAPGVREALRLFWPLLVSGIFVRITIVAERYFGSHLGEGSISEIFYASNIVGPVVLLLSTGIATVFFPRMSQEAAGEDFEKLGATLSLALRGMWVLTAPVMLIGVCLAKPLITAVFVGGRFTAAAGAHVGSLLQIYFLSVAGSSLGMVTGRVLYALKKTGVVAVVSTFEALAYVAYTALLVAWLGAAGVGWGFVIYVTASIPWHLVVIIRAARWMSFPSTIAAMSRTTLAAIAGAGGAYFVTRHTGAGWPQLLAGGVAGVMTFAAALAMVNRPDMTLLVTAARGMVRTSR